MKCFWKWGHDWKPASEEQAKEIGEKLGIFGIHAEKIYICQKCKRVKIVASTFVNCEPRTIILPPYPFRETR